MESTSLYIYTYENGGYYYNADASLWSLHHHLLSLGNILMTVNVHQFQIIHRIDFGASVFFFFL